MLVQGLGELVALVLAQVAGEDLEPPVKFRRGIMCAAEQHVHLLAPLGELVGEVHPPEGHVPLVEPVPGPRGVVHGGLRGEG